MMFHGNTRCGIMSDSSVVSQVIININNYKYIYIATVITLFLMMCGNNRCEYLTKLKLTEIALKLSASELLHVLHAAAHLSYL